MIGPSSPFLEEGWEVAANAARRDVFSASALSRPPCVFTMINLRDKSPAQLSRMTVSINQNRNHMKSNERRGKGPCIQRRRAG